MEGTQTLKMDYRGASQTDVIQRIADEGNRLGLDRKRLTKVTVKAMLGEGIECVFHFTDNVFDIK